MRLTRTATEESTVRLYLPHLETVSAVLIVWICRQRVCATYDAEVDDYVFLGQAVSTTNDSLDDEKEWNRISEQFRPACPGTAAYTVVDCTAGLAGVMMDESV